MSEKEESMSPRPITENTLFYGDNLDILREHIDTECVDLVYLDPPFNSSRNMKTEALSAGYCHSAGWNRDYPRIQILTIAELLHGVEAKIPPQFGPFKQAQRVQQQSDLLQAELGLG